VVPDFFHLRMMEAAVFLGTFNAAEFVWYPSPDLCLDTISYRNISRTINGNRMHLSSISSLIAKDLNS
jgi:hypothetical protein